MKGARTLRKERKWEHLLGMDKMVPLPALLGEVDILGVIQLLPYVRISGEGNSRSYLPGGGPDQNLILLANITVHNASHLFGFLSVHYAFAIKNIQRIKGGMPANFGGHSSLRVTVT